MTLGASGAIYDKKIIKVAVPHHPLAGMGGHQMPTTGKIGGLKRLGNEDDKSMSADAPESHPKV